MAIDLTRGYYRRIYSGFVRGKRINALSLEAEAWFWRVNAAADDYGNLDGEPSLIFAATVGRRTNVTVDDVSSWVGQMLAHGLAAEYEVDGEKYLHIVGFCAIQPSGKNGKRIRRVPSSPYDSQDESWGILNNPNPSSASHNQNHNQDQFKTRSTEFSAVPRNAATPAAESPILLSFPCVRGSQNGPTEWPLTESVVAEFRESFCGFDVLADCRAALAWVRADPKTRRKTASGMKRFLTGWLTRTQNRGTHGHGNGCVPKQTREQRDAAEIDQVMAEFRSEGRAAR